MARLYALSYNWEGLDPVVGTPTGKFSGPVTLEVEADWSTCLETVKTALGPVSTGFGTASSFWEPIFLAGDGGYALRLSREINSLLLAWHKKREEWKARNADMLDALIAGRPVRGGW